MVRCVVSRIFILVAGIRHSAVSKLNSHHSALRNSPGLTKKSGASFSAHFVTKNPSYELIARSKSPIALGSVMLAWCRCWTGFNAPRNEAKDHFRHIRKQLHNGKFGRYFDELYERFQWRLYFRCVAIHLIFQEQIFR